MSVTRRLVSDNCYQMSDVMLCNDYLMSDMRRVVSLWSYTRRLLSDVLHLISDV